MQTGDTERIDEERRDVFFTGRGGPPLKGIVLLALAAALFVPLLVLAFLSVYLLVFGLVIAIPLVALIGLIVANRRGKPVPTVVSVISKEEDVAVAEQEPLPHDGVMAFELETIDIFRDLTDEQAWRVARLAHRRFIEPDTVIAERSSHGDSVFAILDGQIELHSFSAAGDMTVRIAGPGESLPLAALVGNGELITSARTMTKVEAAVLPADALRALCAEEPDIGRKVYAVIAETLADRYRRMLERLSSTFQEALRRTDSWANV